MADTLVKAILPCNYAFQDKQNRWCLIGTYDSVQVSALPGTWGATAVFLRIVDLPQKGTLHVQAEDPAGMVIWTSGPIGFEIAPGGRTSLEAALLMGTIPVLSFGKYRIAVFVNADRVAETEISVMPMSERVAK